MDIRVGVVGEISDGEMRGWSIKVEDDTENTGGYLVLQYSQSDLTAKGFDNWFATLDEVRQYLIYNEISIYWKV